MNPIPIVAALGLVATLGAAPVLAANDNIKFDGAIGSQPLRSPVIPPPPASPPDASPNVVQGVNPGGIPWVIESFKGDIKTDGSISARGEGLLLGGGNTIGARGGTRFVVASLFCPGQANPFNSAAADLDENGDFNIRSPLLNANGAPPSFPCGDNLDNRPVLLIRSATVDANGVATPGNWFAAGILKD